MVLVIPISHEYIRDTVSSQGSPACSLVPYLLVLQQNIKSLNLKTRLFQFSWTNLDLEELAGRLPQQRTPQLNELQPLLIVEADRTEDFVFLAHKPEVHLRSFTSSLDIIVKDGYA